MKRYTRILSVLLCLALCLTLLPAAALAEEENSGEFFAAGEETATVEVENESAAVATEAATEAENTADSEEPYIGDTADEAVLLETYLPDASSLADSVTLFTNYVDQTFSGSAGGEDYVDQTFSGSAGENDGIMLMSSDWGGDCLTGSNAIMYDELKEQIEAVAAGTATDTRLGVSIGDLTKTYVYTAADLGMTEDITEANKSTAVKLALDYDTNLVLSALMADCPYELYWYNKTITTSISANATVSRGNLYLTKTGYIWFFFPVNEAYAADPTVSPSYATDSAKTGAAAQSAAKAQDIVSAAAGYTDYDKLAYYLEQICELTSYNSEAAASTGTYGDPWQIIYVFDGDPDTTVVCEGYAKAFQYLCDLTQFDNSSIHSFLVNGTIQVEGDDAGKHMWNQVHMPDGKNYLVDVTNCDGDAIGAPNNLFLRGTDTGSVDDGYTITVNGTSVYYVYSTEETPFGDSDLELSTADCFDALTVDHSWPDWTVDTSAGIKTRTCPICGNTEVCHLGDVNRDGLVNLKDLLVLKTYLAGGSSVSIYKEGADLDMKGDVNLKDLLLLKQKLATA